METTNKKILHIFTDSDFNEKLNKECCANGYGFESETDPIKVFENLDYHIRAILVSGKLLRKELPVFFKLFKLKFHRNCALIVHPTIRNSASIKDFRGSFCSLLQTALKSSLNATLAMICLKSEKAKLLRPLTLWRRSGVFLSRMP
jgi:hypothetical protein